MDTRIKSEDAPVYQKSPASNDGDTIIADALSILKGRLKQHSRGFSSPADVKNYALLQLAELEREAFGVLFLTSQHDLIADEILFYGTIDGASVHREDIGYPPGIGYPDAGSHCCRRRRDGIFRRTWLLIRAPQ